MESKPGSSMINSTENSVPPLSRKRLCQKKTSGKRHKRRAPLKSIPNFVVQCANCDKWRLVSSKKKYEKIREKIEDDPFVCEKAREWKANVTCDDPSDVSPHGGKRWVIDRPNIAPAPQGWERLVKMRSNGGSYVHYKPPTGRQLRSLDDAKAPSRMCCPRCENISVFIPGTETT